jgi:DNA-binding response OmpR family regulator
MSVQVAHDGRSGLNLARSGQHDLAILDVMLPELTGLQGEATAKQLHHRRFDADRPW